MLFEEAYMKNLVIFGAGAIGKKILNSPLRPGWNIFAVVDNNPQLWGSSINGFVISSPNSISAKDVDVFLISTQNQWMNAIRCQLHEELHVPYEKIRLALGSWGMTQCSTIMDEFFVIEKATPEVPFHKGPAVIYQDYKGETYKSHNRREREGFFRKYCQGNGLDVCYGSDLIVPDCSGWDIRNGDAQYLATIPDESFDFVYSSHGLEHMADVRVALKNWYRVVKKGGYLLIAIPHRDLYEKKSQLPSRWNGDHKHFFLIGKEEPPDTLDIVHEVKEALEDYDIKYVKACDEGHTITDPSIHSDGEYQIEIVIQKKS